MLTAGQRLRLRRLGDHPRSVGFPPHHPPMASLLAVPVAGSSPFRGNLYLTEKLERRRSSAKRTRTPWCASPPRRRWPSTTPTSISRSKELAAAEERLRIAHEMHDGLAQVLAYVNTKAQAVKEFLRAGAAEQATDQLDQLAAAAREVYTDVREAILGLRAAADPDTGLAEALRGYVETWQDHDRDRRRAGDGADRRLRRGSSCSSLRIVQESLANVRKHAGASPRRDPAGGDARRAAAVHRRRRRRLHPGRRAPRPFPASVSPPCASGWRASAVQSR